MGRKSTLEIYWASDGSSEILTEHPPGVMFGRSRSASESKELQKSLARTVFRPFAWALATASDTADSARAFIAPIASPPVLQPCALKASLTLLATTIPESELPLPMS